MSSLNLGSDGGGADDMVSEPGPQAKVRHTMPRVLHGDQNSQVEIRGRPRRSQFEVSTAVKDFDGGIKNQVLPLSLLFHRQFFYILSFLNLVCKPASSSVFFHEAFQVARVLALKGVYTMSRA